LINVGSGSGAELFKVADTHEMRVYVKVPQAYAGQLHAGLVADLKLVQYPDKVFTARLETMSNAIAKDSRTVLVELLADNPDGKLWPGTFAEVHFKLPADPNVYRLPTSSLVFREHGLQVATVGANGRADLKPVTPGRDLGTEIEILSGLDPSDRVIDNPPDSLGTGDRVTIAGADPAEGARTAMAAPPTSGDRK
jgi:RND family efflux transporter MFP subunit